MLLEVEADVVAAWPAFETERAARISSATSRLRPAARHSPTPTLGSPRRCRPRTAAARRPAPTGTRASCEWPPGTSPALAARLCSRHLLGISHPTVGQAPRRWTEAASEVRPRQPPRQGDGQHDVTQPDRPMFPDGGEALRRDAERTSGGGPRSHPRKLSGECNRSSRPRSRSCARRSQKIPGAPRGARVVFMPRGHRPPHYLANNYLPAGALPLGRPRARRYPRSKRLSTRPGLGSRRTVPMKSGHLGWPATSARSGTSDKSALQRTPSAAR